MGIEFQLGHMKMFWRSTMVIVLKQIGMYLITKNCVLDHSELGKFDTIFYHGVREKEERENKEKGRGGSGERERGKKEKKTVDFESRLF